MFDSVLIEEKRRRDKVYAFARWWSRNRYSRVLSGCVLVLTGLSAFGASYVYFIAGPTNCEVLRPTDLTMAQLKQVKRKVTEYEANPIGEIHLDAAEASFILADNLKYLVKIDLSGEEMAAKLFIRAAQQELCYSIQFTGTVEVDRGMATVVPSHLMIGRLDLTWLTRGQTFRIDADLIGKGDAGDFLQQTESLRIKDGQLHVDLEDPRRLR